ncbi:DUF2029 domain-containing protein [Cryobacterium breve]|uniref:DUF2029 domain-containing protein n=1 Tax=Cryobacterium breve TaxID=1259258 RepID=A0ABY7NA27_9MICO|nr:glycosyltransferase family 87 protein [Cryobacterium breve]WBM79149.1 DUF2029 domain-containing protein [Cryobacterium breve]
MSYILDQVDHRVRRVLTPARRVWLETPRTLVIGFIAIHVVFLLALLPAILTGNVLGDLPLYRTWAQQGLVHQIWMGINVEWVYPIGALFPIVFAGLGGPLLYQLMWFLMTAALNALAVMVLTDAGRKISGYRSAWFFLLISFVLSPVGLLRLEGLTAPLVIMGLVLLARRPVVAAALLTIATWVKVWPAAVVVAVVVASRRRITVILTGIAVTGGIVATVFALGGLKYITGFVTMQSDRAMQLEAPITTPWVWLAALGHPNTFIYQNYAIATREVSGPGTTLVASLMNPLMFIAMGAIVTLMLVALRRHHDVSQAPARRVARARRRLHHLQQSRIPAVHALARTRRHRRRQPQLARLACAGVHDGRDRHSDHPDLPGVLHATRQRRPLGARSPYSTQRPPGRHVRLVSRHPLAHGRGSGHLARAAVPPPGRQQQPQRRRVVHSAPVSFGRFSVASPAEGQWSSDFRNDLRPYPPRPDRLECRHADPGSFGHPPE